MFMLWLLLLKVCRLSFELVGIIFASDVCRSWVLLQLGYSPVQFIHLGKLLFSCFFFGQWFLRLLLSHGFGFWKVH